MENFSQNLDYIKKEMDEVSLPKQTDTECLKLADQKMEHLNLDEVLLPKQINTEGIKPADQKTEHINLEFFINLEKAGKKNVIDFCTQMGFIAGSYECPDCSKPMRFSCQKDRGQDGYVWYCKHTAAGIYNRRSVRSGSWFQESRLSMTMMLKLAYLWVKKTPYNWIADELKLSKNTVTYWMAFFKRICLKAIQTEPIFLGGPNELVEIDAKSFSIAKSRGGHETWVFGGIERSSKKCFLEIILTGEEDEILGILQKYVLPGTTIISDNWKGFDCLKNNGYLHQKLGKTAGFKNPITGLHKNTILNLWSVVKKILNKRIGNDQLDSHLAEIVWRRSHQEETQVLLRSYFKLLSQTFVPRVRDDPSYKSKREEMSEKEDFTRSLSDVELSEMEFILETQSTDVNTDNFEEEAHSNDVNTDNFEREDKFESENGSQKKRLKTEESSNT